MDKKTKFLNLYANLPLNLRNEVVLVFKKEPITWSVAYSEISNDTPTGKEVLEKLSELKII